MKCFSGALQAFHAPWSSRHAAKRTSAFDTASCSQRDECRQSAEEEAVVHRDKMTGMDQTEPPRTPVHGFRSLSLSGVSTAPPSPEPKSQDVETAPASARQQAENFLRAGAEELAHLDVALPLDLLAMEIPRRLPVVDFLEFRTVCRQASESFAFKELLKVPRPDLMMREARRHNLSAEELEQKFGTSNTPYLKYGPARGTFFGRPEGSELVNMRDYSYHHMHSPMSWAEWVAKMWDMTWCCQDGRCEAMEFVVDPPLTAAEFRRRSYANHKRTGRLGGPPHFSMPNKADGVQPPLILVFESSLQQPSRR
eukprot:s2577_g12.t1